MTRRSASSLEVFVAALAFLSIVMFRVEMVESARILRPSIPGNISHFPPPPPGPDSIGSGFGEAKSTPLMQSSAVSKSGRDISVAGVGAAGTYSKLTVARFRQLFGSMLPRGSKIPPAGIPSGTGVDRFHKFGSMLPRGVPIPPAGIPSPIHN